MDKWIDVVTNPLGIVGFALFLVFTFASRSQRPRERYVFIGFAAVALLAGLGLAYRHASEPPPAESKPTIAKPAHPKSPPAPQGESVSPEAQAPEPTPANGGQTANADRGGTATNIGGNVINPRLFIRKYWVLNPIYVT